MNYLTPKRMMSLENLADRFGMDHEELWKQLDSLEKEGRVRRVRPRCSGVCTSCSSCDEEPVKNGPIAVDPAVIVISCEMCEDFEE